MVGRWIELVEGVGMVARGGNGRERRVREKTRLTDNLEEGTFKILVRSR